MFWSQFCVHLLLVYLEIIKNTNYQKEGLQHSNSSVGRISWIK